MIRLFSDLKTINLPIPQITIIYEIIKSKIKLWIKNILVDGV